MRFLGKAHPKRSSSRASPKPLGVPIDRSFVAIVPIGGRHVEHFWRLVTQLGIPHTTLLDLDLGRKQRRHRAIQGRCKCDPALKTPSDEETKKIWMPYCFDRGTDWAAKGGWTKVILQSWIDFFEQQDVFFSTPLDLDMLMLEAFPAAYKKLPKG